jgi:hypothetical protein
VKPTLIIAILIVLAPALVTGAVLRVPADHPTITAAVAASAADDEVVIDPGVYLEHGITITGSLTLRSAVPGEAVTIDGQGLGTVMTLDIPDADVDVSDLAFLRGGDGVMVVQRSGATASFSRCEFGENAGTGLLIEGGFAGDVVQVDLESCRFVDNDEHGFFCGPGMVRITMADCEVTGNGDTGLFAVSAVLDVQDTMIAGNAADTGGGASLIGCTSELRRVEFRDNVALERGGGVSVHATGTYLFDDCTFDGNAAPLAAQAYFHNMEGFTIDARFNCCDIDTSEFAGPAWDAGMVTITHEGCTVPVATRSWSAVKAAFD